MSQRTRKLIGQFLPPLVTLTILVILWWQTNAQFTDLRGVISRCDGRILAATLLFSVVWHIFLGSHKWWRVLCAMGANVPFVEVLRVRMGSDPIRVSMPMKTGELVNAAYFARLQSMGFGRSAGSIVFDKGLNFFGEIFWLYLGIVTLAQVPSPGYLAIHTAIGAAVVILFAARSARRALTGVAGAIHPKLGRLATGVLSAFEEFSVGQKLGFLCYGAFFQIRPLAVCGLVLWAFGPTRLPSLPELLVLGSVVVLLSNLPSMAGIGPREAALMAMFADFADPTTLLGVGLAMSFIVQVIPAMIGIPLMFPLLRELSQNPSAIPDPNRPVERDPVG